MQIAQVTATFAGAERAVEFGFDCVALVYPSLIWNEALAQTRRELSWVPPEG
jgi:hypothetical protein